MKINALIWLRHEEQLDERLKKLQGTEGAHLSEPQKAHATSEFTLLWWKIMAIHYFA